MNFWKLTIWNFKDDIYICMLFNINLTFNIMICDISNKSSCWNCELTNKMLNLWTLFVFWKFDVWTCGIMMLWFWNFEILIVYKFMCFVGFQVCAVLVFKLCVVWCWLCLYIYTLVGGWLLKFNILTLTFWILKIWLVNCSFVCVFFNVDWLYVEFWSSCVWHAGNLIVLMCVYVFFLHVVVFFDYCSYFTKTK